MGEVSNGEAFDANSNPSLMDSLKGIYKREMDTVIQTGRYISIDLEPAREDCPVNCTYNPVYEKHQGPDGQLCRTCKGQGFIYDPRFTRYQCNRRWTNEPYDQSENTGENTKGGRIVGNYVRVKTVAASFDHIKNSIGATIDGQKVKLFEEPRYVGWANSNDYVISWWERAGK